MTLGNIIDEMVMLYLYVVSIYDSMDNIFHHHQYATLSSYIKRCVECGTLQFDCPNSDCNHTGHTIVETESTVKMECRNNHEWEVDPNTYWEAREARYRELAKRHGKEPDAAVERAKQRGELKQW